MDIRVPATRDGQTICRNLLTGGQGDLFQSLAPGCVHNAGAHNNFCMRNFGYWGNIAAVNNRSHRHALGAEIARSAPPIIIIGKNADPLARCRSKSVYIATHRARKHDPRAIIIAKGNRAFRCTRGQDCAL